jgi:hypothetical protein
VVSGGKAIGCGLWAMGYCEGGTAPSSKLQLLAISQ